MKSKYVIRVYDRQGQFTSISFEAAQYQAKTAFFALVAALTISEYSEVQLCVSAPNMFVVLDKVLISWRG